MLHRFRNGHFAGVTPLLIAQALQQRDSLLEDRLLEHLSVLDRLADDNKHFLRYALGSLAECDTQLIIAESLGYGEYSKQPKATMMSLTMGIRAYGKSLA